MEYLIIFDLITVTGSLADQVKKWLAKLNVKALFIEPGSPPANGYNESFSGKLLDELLNREISFILKEHRLVGAGHSREY